MPDPLSADEIERIKSDHIDDGHGYCLIECSRDDEYTTPFPCDAALLMAELERVSAELAKWEDSHE